MPRRPKDAIMGYTLRPDIEVAAETFANLGVLMSTYLPDLLDG